MAQDAAVWLMHGIDLALRHILGYATFILLCAQAHNRMNPTRVGLGIFEGSNRSCVTHVATHSLRDRFEAWIEQPAFTRSRPMGVRSLRKSRRVLFGECS